MKGRGRKKEKKEKKSRNSLAGFHTDRIVGTQPSFVPPSWCGVGGVSRALPPPYLPLAAAPVGVPLPGCKASTPDAALFWLQPGLLGAQVPRLLWGSALWMQTPGSPLLLAFPAVRGVTEQHDLLQPCPRAWHCLELPPQGAQ